MIRTLWLFIIIICSPIFISSESFAREPYQYHQNMTLFYLTDQYKVYRTETNIAWTLRQECRLSMQSDDFETMFVAKNFDNDIEFAMISVVFNDGYFSSGFSADVDGQQWIKSKMYMENIDASFAFAPQNHFDLLKDKRALKIKAYIEKGTSEPVENIIDLKEFPRANRWR